MHENLMFRRVRSERIQLGRTLRNQTTRGLLFSFGFLVDNDGSELKNQGF